MIQTVADRYNGITVDSKTFPETKEEFEKEITDLMNSIIDKKLLWIKIPTEKSDFIPILTNLSFDFHHCDEKELMLVKKLIQNPIIPTAKNYTVGVGALVRDGEKLLVIKDKFSKGYKLPGGHVDDNEQLKEALKREVYEETGIEVDFESIVNLGHFPNGQFGVSSLYIVCTAKPLTKEIHIYDASEIVEAKWIDLEEFLNSNEVNSYNRAVVKAATESGDLKLTNQTISLNLPLAEIFF